MTNVYLIGVGIVLLGVGAIMTSHRTAGGAPTAEKPAFVYKVDGYSVREFLLSDGTRCILVSNNAITCSWGNK